MQKHEEIKKLFERYRQDKCTPEERVQLHAWFNHFAKQEAHGLLTTKEHSNVSRRMRWIRYLPYAAAVIILFANVWYTKKDSKESVSSKIVGSTMEDIAPGHSRATLTLADGSVVGLNETESGIIMTGSNITYEGGDSLVLVSGSKERKKESSPLLQLATPRGGTYQVTLSDGTKVWLNSSTTLKYPLAFGDDVRSVEINGEAYFVVAKDKSRPFRVYSKGQEIKVLGTEFNVSAYPDEPDTKTTLIDGSVEVTNLHSNVVNRLVPGKQSVVNDGNTNVRDVLVEKDIAWKSGSFYFDNTPIEEMLKQVSRWYDVEVVYERNVPKDRFSGTMSRNVTLQTVLELLRISEITYRIEKNKLIIN